MSNADLGPLVSKHNSSARGITLAVVGYALVLVVCIAGTVTLMTIEPMHGKKADPRVIMWIGIGSTFFMGLCSLSFLIPQCLNYGNAIDIYEKGIVLRGKRGRRVAPFTDILEAREDMMFFGSIKTNHSLSLKLKNGKGASFSATSVSDFETLRDEMIAGITKWHVPMLAQSLKAGKRVPFGWSTLEPVGIELKNQGQTIPWNHLRSVSIDSNGHLVFTTSLGKVVSRGVFGTIPHWFLIMPLAEAMCAERA